jgi:hypothetical protein
MVPRLPAAAGLARENAASAIAGAQPVGLVYTWRKAVRRELIKNGGIARLFEIGTRHALLLAPPSSLE